jgi:hypothetical protein
MEAIVFSLAGAWFGGKAAATVEAEIAALPPRIHSWIREFAVSPATQGFRANKDQLWLHLCLVESRSDALAVAARRLFPASLPVVAGDAFVSKEGLTYRDWLRWRWYWVAHFLKRACYHAAALPATARSGIRWWRAPMHPATRSDSASA